MKGYIKILTFAIQIQILMANLVNLDHYDFFHLYDSWGDCNLSSQPSSSLTIEQLAAECDKRLDCAGFNYEGKFKRYIVSQQCHWDSWKNLCSITQCSPKLGLYVKKPHSFNLNFDYNQANCACRGNDCITDKKNENGKCDVSYPDCNADWTLIGDGRCNGKKTYNAACAFDGNDCDDLVASWPECPNHVQNAWRAMDGNCDIGDSNEAALFSLACGFDGGDCSSFNPKYDPANYVNCQTDEPQRIGDSICDVEYNTADCFWDGADCVIPDYPKCRVSDPTLIGNGVCDKGAYNSLDCGFDGGDCVTSTVNLVLDGHGETVPFTIEASNGNVLHLSMQENGNWCDGKSTTLALGTDYESNFGSFFLGKGGTIRSMYCPDLALAIDRSTCSTLILESVNQASTSQTWKIKTMENDASSFEWIKASIVNPMACGTEKAITLNSVNNRLDVSATQTKSMENKSQSFTFKPISQFSNVGTSGSKVKFSPMVRFHNDHCLASDLNSMTVRLQKCQQNQNQHFQIHNGKIMSEDGKFCLGSTASNSVNLSKCVDGDLSQRWELDNEDGYIENVYTSQYLGLSSCDIADDISLKLVDPSNIGSSFCEEGFRWRAYTPCETTSGALGRKCNKFNHVYPECKTLWPEWVADGQCDEELNNVGCDNDGGDCNQMSEVNHCLVQNNCGSFESCVTMSSRFPECKRSDICSIGNSICDDDLNNYECGYDGGDCNVTGIVSAAVGTVVGFTVAGLAYIYYRKQRNKKEAALRAKRSSSRKRKSRTK